MPRNAEVADIFDELADRLLSQGESWFKVSAYRKGAAAIRGATEPVEELSAAGRLRTLPGVGKAIVEKTVAYLATGTFPLLNHARAVDAAAGDRQPAVEKGPSSSGDG